MTAGERRDIYCAGCGMSVQAELVRGASIYPHRGDLASKAFWKCPTCLNYVGCHQQKGFRPLGIIPTPELRSARGHIHRILDPLWKTGRFTRRQVYAELSARIGREYHTAEIRSIDEARAVYRAVQEIHRIGLTQEREKPCNTTGSRR